MSTHDKNHAGKLSDIRVAQRRELLTKGATAAALAAVGLVAAACGDDESDDDGGGTGGTSGTSGRGGTSGMSGTGGMSGMSGTGGMMATPDADIEPLNALLTAEYNAITAYTAGAGLIDAAQDTDPLYALRSVIIDVAVSFQAQHRLHAEALVDAIEELDGTPVEEADVAEAFEAPEGLVASPTITNVLKFAAGAERAAAVAYNQVLAGFEAAHHRFLASAIEGDETQHFIVLAALVLGLAAPGPNLSSDTAGDVVPAAFATTVGDEQGLNDVPPDYFA